MSANFSPIIDQGITLPPETPLWLLLLVATGTTIWNAVWPLLKARAEDAAKARMEADRRKLDAEIADRQRDSDRETKLLDFWREALMDMFRNQQTLLRQMTESIQQQGVLMQQMSAEMAAMRRSDEDARVSLTTLRSAQTALIERLPNVAELVEPGRRIEAHLNWQSDQLKLLIATLAAQGIHVPMANRRRSDVPPGDQAPPSVASPATIPAPQPGGAMEL